MQIYIHLDKYAKFTLTNISYMNKKTNVCKNGFSYE